MTNKRLTWQAMSTRLSQWRYSSMIWYDVIMTMIIVNASFLSTIHLIIIIIIIAFVFHLLSLSLQIEIEIDNEIGRSEVSWVETNSWYRLEPSKLLFHYSSPHSTIITWSYSWHTLVSNRILTLSCCKSKEQEAIAQLCLKWWWGIRKGFVHREVWDSFIP
jgi:hypothetical protein